jgi:long-chain acyl-CoA synthetase
VPTASTLIGIFLDCVDTHHKPDQFLTKSPAGWRRVSGDEALAEVESLAMGLRDLGLARGDRLAILSESRLEWPFTDFAALGLGAVVVPIYPTLPAEQVRQVLENSGTRLIVASTSTQLAKARVAAAGLPEVAGIVTIDAKPERAGEHAYRDVVRRGGEVRGREPGAFRASAEAVRPTDLATIIYTSGTTGEPKGAMLSHGNIASNVASGLQVMPIATGDTCLSFLPLCHIFERMGGLYAMLARGVTIAYAENMDTVAANAVEVRPMLLMGVPRFYEKVRARVLDNAHTLPPLRRAIFRWGLAAGQAAARAHLERRPLGSWPRLKARIADRLVGAKIRERVGGRLKFGISGSAPLSTQVLEFFFAIGVPIHEGYGLTETSPVITLNPPGREKPGSVGPPIPGVEVRIEAHADFPPSRDGHMVGEILTRGPHVMQGYYRNEAATNEALRGGWFHTGDVGYLDADNYLYITDRLKDLLVTAGGKKVAPQPIENELRRGRWIAEAVLLGDGRPYVVALLVPQYAALEAEAKANGWRAGSRAELLAHPSVRALIQGEVDRVNAPLAPFQTIKRFALFESELTQEAGELTPTLKVKRRVITQRYAAMIDALYAVSESGRSATS